MMDEPPRASRVGLVLAGGGARAAYEVGVVHYLLHEVARELGADVPLDVLAGTSAGAINACGLAAYADEPKRRADRLVEHWRSLSVERILRPDAWELVGFALGACGVRAGNINGGLIHPAGLRRILGDAIPFERVGEHVASGRLHALCVSATHVRSGKTVVFVQGTESALPSWGQDTTVEPRAAAITLEHALASAAIPFLFPAMTLDGQLYCDGALRQNVPLSPARRLGSDALIVISPHQAADAAAAQELGAEREQAFAGPAFLLGKTLNSLLLDRLDGDVDRLNRINQILDAGVQKYGPGFTDVLNQSLGRSDCARLRRIESVVIRPSQNIGVLASRYLRSAEFLRGRAIGGRVFRRLVDGFGEADLASFLLFDGGFAAQLIELGRADARAHHQRLCSLLGEIVARRRSICASAA